MQSPTPLGENLSRTVELLREKVGQHAVKFRALAPLILLVWNRICRLRNRFTRLVLLWERGQLPTSRPRAKRAHQPRPKPELRLPTANHWLLKLVPGTAENIGHIEGLLNDADVHALVAAHPPAARILRPWAKMFGMPLPDHLTLPPRPRRPRRQQPKAEPAIPRRLSRQRILAMTGAELHAYFHPLPPHFPLAIPHLRLIRKKIAQG